MRLELERKNETRRTVEVDGQSSNSSDSSDSSSNLTAPSCSLSVDPYQTEQVFNNDCFNNSTNSRASEYDQSFNRINSINYYWSTIMRQHTQQWREFHEIFFDLSFISSRLELMIHVSALVLLTEKERARESIPSTHIHAMQLVLLDFRLLVHFHGVMRGPNHRADSQILYARSGHHWNATWCLEERVIRS